MKIKLELVINEEPDGRKFLNFWDSNRGEDVCCQIIDGELILLPYDEDGNELPKKEIPLSEFISMVEKVVKQ